jgi:hypothetical protein
MIALPNDTTKPSRVNRNRKKGWKIGAGLTGYFMAAILTLSCKCKAGICSPRKATNGHFLQWFFCTHQKHNSILLWWAVLSNPLKGWPGLAGTANLIQSATRCFAALRGGLSLLQGVPQ